MKTSILGIAIASLVLPTSAHAGIAPTDYVESNLAFIMTITYTDPNLRERDHDGSIIRGGEMVYENQWIAERGAVISENYEYGAKMSTERVSNREILQEVVVEGGYDDSIRGWSLKLLTPTDYDSCFCYFDLSESSEEPVKDDFVIVPIGRGGPTILAVKGDQIIEIPMFVETYAEAETARYIESFAYNANTDTETVRKSGAATIMSETYAGLQIGDVALEFASIMNTSERLTPVERGSSIYAWIPRSITLNNIVGSVRETDGYPSIMLPNVEVEEETAVLQGIMRANGGTLMQDDYRMTR